jgi:hypothetical protein
MSSNNPDPNPGWQPDFNDLQAIIDYYQSRPVEFFEDIGFTLADTQKRILRACLEHHRILVMSGNGTGKTAGVMMAIYWYVILRWNSLGLVTSGNYDVLKDTAWPFLQTIHDHAQDAFPDLPGVPKQSSPRIDMEDWPEWWLRFRSPTHADNLQGRHGRRAFVVIDEADKPDVTDEHFSSATSTASSMDDVVVAIANPPKERANAVYDKLSDDRWHTIQFSSFDSHNVQRALGWLDDDQRGRIPGVVDLDLVIEDYEDKNGYDWPGAQEALRAIQKTDDGYWKAREDHARDLSPDWYRKRLGVMPPTGQGVLRPFYERHVDDAVERYRERTRQGQQPALARGQVVQSGDDIARGGGDRTVQVNRHDTGLLAVAIQERAGDHERNYDLIVDADSQVDRQGPLVVDAVGEGSGVADRLRSKLPGVKRFDGGANADQDDEYYDAATEAYVHLGNHLKADGLVPPNTELERELRMAARVLELNERSLRGGTTLKANGKQALKGREYLGRSPDFLDAAALACYDVYTSDFQVPDVTGVVG